MHPWWCDKQHKVQCDTFISQSVSVNSQTGHFLCSPGGQITDRLVLMKHPYSNVRSIELSSSRGSSYAEPRQPSCLMLMRVHEQA